jgi:two-component system, LuxR family, response regulator FixJ
MNASTATVYIVDDDEAVRSALRLLLKSAGYVTAAFDSAQEFLSRYSTQQPGCLVLDVRMPGMSGLELQQELNRRGAIIPVIFISGHGDIPMAVEAIHAGAFDFLQKPFKDQELLDRVAKALATDALLRAQHIEAASVQELLATLTPREQEVLGMVVAGKPNKIMAVDLNLSQRTVEVHRARVMEKMHVRSLAELVRMMMVTKGLPHK